MGAEWDSCHAVCKYCVRCQSRVETLTLERSALHAVIENFSPWLPERFEFFREAVIETLHNSTVAKRRTLGATIDQDGNRGSLSPLPIEKIRQPLPGCVSFEQDSNDPAGHVSGR